jgi:hypothetical protein
MATFNILSVISVVFYLAACITPVNSEIGELPFCNPDEVNRELK